MLCVATMVYGFFIRTFERLIHNSCLRCSERQAGRSSPGQNVTSTFRHISPVTLRHPAVHRNMLVLRMRQVYEEYVLSSKDFHLRRMPSHLRPSVQKNEKPLMFDLRRRRFVCTSLLFFKNVYSAKMSSEDRSRSSNRSSGCKIDVKIHISEYGQFP